MTVVKNPGEGVSYTSAGNWKPTIHGCICEQCGVEFTGHVKNPRFCSKKCAGASRRGVRVKHTERECPSCKKKWSAPPSNPSKYCSKSCMYKGMGWTKHRNKKCPQCGKGFRPKWRTDRGKLQTYCSNNCAVEASKKQLKKKCVACGKDFFVTPSKRHEKTCSRECADAYYIRDQSHNWRGGKVLQNERLFRRLDRDGYAAKYEGEHRLVAAREMGRPIERGEVILCLDRDNTNLSPENLFFIPSLKELGLIMTGAVEWPKASNLKQMRNAKYIRPDVIILLHEWEDGKRRESTRGKPITRHPQADEIIKRRRAGATARELAVEFETNLSSMAAILRRRL